MSCEIIELDELDSVLLRRKLWRKTFDHIWDHIEHDMTMRFNTAKRGIERALDE